MFALLPQHALDLFARALQLLLRRLLVLVPVGRTSQCFLKVTPLLLVQPILAKLLGELSHRLGGCLRIGAAQCLGELPRLFVVLQSIADFTQRIAQRLAVVAGAVFQFVLELLEPAERFLTIEPLVGELSDELIEAIDRVAARLGVGSRFHLARKLLERFEVVVVEKERIARDDRRDTMRHDDLRSHFDEAHDTEHRDHRSGETCFRGPAPSQRVGGPQVAATHRVRRVGQRGIHHRRPLRAGEGGELEGIGEAVVEAIGPIEKLGGDERRDASRESDDDSEDREEQRADQEPAGGVVTKAAELRGEQDEHSERGAVQGQLDSAANCSQQTDTPTHSSYCCEGEVIVRTAGTLFLLHSRGARSLRTT